MYPFAFGAAASELSLSEILAELPHDGGAVIALLLLGGFVVMTWYGSRRSTIERYRSVEVEAPVATAEDEEEVATEEWTAEVAPGPLQEVGPEVPSARSRAPRSRANVDRAPRA